MSRGVAHRSRFLTGVGHRSRFLTGVGLWLLSLILIANAPIPSSLVQILEEESEGHEDAKKDIEEKQAKEAARQVPPHHLARRVTPYLVAHPPLRVSQPVADAPHPDPTRFSVRRLL